VVKLRDKLPEPIYTIKSAFSSAGVATISDLHNSAQLELVSGLSIREGGVHDIYLPQTDAQYTQRTWGD
jgi:hypothetical protein